MEPENITLPEKPEHFDPRQWTISEIWAAASIFKKSGYIPGDLNQSQIAAKMFIGQHLGISPVGALFDLEVEPGKIKWKYGAKDPEGNEMPLFQAVSDEIALKDAENRVLSASDDPKGKDALTIVGQPPASNQAAKREAGGLLSKNQEPEKPGDVLEFKTAAGAEGDADRSTPETAIGSTTETKDDPAPEKTPEPPAAPAHISMHKPRDPMARSLSEFAAPAQKINLARLAAEKGVDLEKVSYSLLTAKTGELNIDAAKWLIVYLENLPDASTPPALGAVAESEDPLCELCRGRHPENHSCIPVAGMDTSEPETAANAGAVDAAGGHHAIVAKDAGITGDPWETVGAWRVAIETFVAFLGTDKKVTLEEFDKKGVIEQKAMFERFQAVVDEKLKELRDDVWLMSEQLQIENPTSKVVAFDQKQTPVEKKDYHATVKKYYDEQTDVARKEIEFYIKDLAAGKFEETTDKLDLPDDPNAWDFAACMKIRAELMTLGIIPSTK